MFVEQNKDFAIEIEAKIREKVFPGQILKNKEGVPVNTTKPSKAAKTASKEETEAPLKATTKKASEKSLDDVPVAVPGDLF